MGLFRLFLKAFVSKSHPARTQVVHEKLPSMDRQALGGRSSVLPAKQHEVRALAHAVSTETHKVTIQGRCHVVDGDTIVIGDASIRLAGIDAPELDHPYGKNAKWALVNLCKGQIVHAVLEGAMSHDRTVATCYLPDGRDLSAEMVKLGLAVDWPKFSGGKYRVFEEAGIRRKLWRCNARQKGRMPPSTLPD
jgi:endonuclease YncB( thermonuclease family)